MFDQHPSDKRNLVKATRAADQSGVIACVPYRLMKHFFWRPP
jgi:hypothetical protein